MCRTTVNACPAHNSDVPAGYQDTYVYLELWECARVKKEAADYTVSQKHLSASTSATADRLIGASLPSARSRT